MFERFRSFQARAGLALVGVMFPLVGICSLAFGVLELTQGQWRGVLFLLLGIAFATVGVIAWLARSSFKPPR